MPPEIPLLYRNVLAILGFLFFHIKLIFVLSRSMKNFVGILIGIELSSVSLPHTWVQKKSLYNPRSLIYSHVLYITISRPIGNFLQILSFLITQH